MALSLASLIDFPLQIGANTILFFALGSVLISFPQKRSIQPWKYRVVLGPIISLHLLILSPISFYQSTEKYLSLGEQARQLNNTSLAHEYLKIAIRSAPLASRPIRQYALSMREQDMKTALKLSEMSTLMAPGNALTWMSYAELLVQEERYHDAVHMWKKTLDLDVPNNDDAIPYIKKILSLPLPVSDILTLLNFERYDRKRQLARALSDMGEIKHAKAQLKPFLENNASMQILMAELELRQNNALEAWNLIKEHRPKNCRIAKLAAKALLLSGQSKEAIKYYRIAVDHCGNNNSLSRMSLIARLIEGEERAQMEALVLLRKKKKNTRIRRLVLHNLALKGDYQAMIPHLNKLKEQDKITPEELDDLQRIMYGLPLEHYPLRAP